MSLTERMKTKIKVGERYQMRDGTKWTVTEMRDEDHFLIDKDNPEEGYIDTSMHKQFIVGVFGNFGYCPNPFDLVKQIS
jgi:hypothetical protein